MGFFSKIWKGVKRVTGITALLKGIKKWLTPDVEGKKAFEVQRSGSNHRIPIVYGTDGKVGGIAVDRNVTDAPGGAENEFFSVLYVFCYGEIEAFQEFFFNDVSENDPKWLKDKNNPAGAKWFTKEVRLGTAAQTAVNAVGKLNRFSATTSKYEGLAIAFFTFQQDPDQSIWGGEPQVTARIKGKKVYDLRTGLTVYSENPALHLYDYLKSPIYGKALTDADLDLDSFIAVANICDQDETATVSTLECKTVSGAYICTGSAAETVNFKRFSNNTIINTETDIFKNMQEIANSFRGFFPDSDGRIKIATEIEASPVATIDEDSIVSDLSISRASKNERYNRVVVRFKNANANYEADEVVWPDADSEIYQQWLEEDNGIVLEHTIQAEYIKYKALALQLAELAAKISRNMEEIQFTATAKFMQLDVGDVFALNYTSYGFEGRQYRISNNEYREDMLVNITAELHNNSLYPWSDLEYEEFLGGSNLGDPNNMPPPTDLAIAADPTFATSGALSWSVPNNAFIRRFDVQINLGSTIVYRAETLGQSFSIPLFNVGLYSISVRSVSALGTLSQAASISLNLQIPIPPTDIEFNVTYESIEAKPVLAGIGLGTTFEYAIITASPVGRGSTFIFIGLAHSTEYEVFVRTVTALGVSAWFSKVATTSNNANNLIDLIGQDIGDQIFDDVVAEVNANLETVVDAALVEYPKTTDVQALIDDSLDLINGAEVEDARFEMMQSIHSVLDENSNRAEIRRTDIAISAEGQLRAAAILQLNVADQAIIEQVQQVQTDTNGNSSAINVLQGQVNNPITGLTASFNLAQTANTKADGNANSISQIINEIESPTGGLNALASFIQEVDLKAEEAQSDADAAQDTANAALSSATAITNAVNNPTTGLSATNTLAQQAKTTADGAVSSVTTLSGQVNNPTTGLSATYTLAQSAKSTADGNTSSITTISNTINNPTNGLSASFTLATTANNTANTADGKANANALSIASLNTRVATAEGNISSAQLTLQSTIDELGNVSSRAFLGVTTVTGGVARINGIVIDGTTNALEFRADTLRLTDVGGTLQLYWSAARSKWVFSGDIVAATFQTATSGYRAEMSGVGTIPFWYGTGAKNWANARFAVDLLGNVVMRNADIVNAAISGTLNGVNGTFSGSLNAASGTFVGVVSVVRGTKRIRIDPSSALPFWFGNNSIAVGSQSQENGDFWIDDSGRYPAPQRTSQAYSQNLTKASPSAVFNLPVKTIKGVCDVDFYIDDITITATGGGANAQINFTLKDGAGATVSSITRSTAMPVIFPPTKIGGLTSFTKIASISHSGLAYATNRNLSLTITITNASEFTTIEAFVGATIRALEVKSIA